MADGVGGIGSRKKGPTKWEGPPGTICHGAIMDRLFLRRRHRLPKKRGPDRDKWSKTTQETLGGSGGSEVNGALRNPYHPPGVTIYIEKNIYIIEKRLTDQSY